MVHFRIVFVMILWGSICIFTRFINMSPILLAFLRASIALIVIALYGLKTKSLRLKGNTLRDVLPFMLSGVIMGFSWVTLFLGFANTDIATSIIAYNMCPVYVLLLAPLLLKERLRVVHIFAVVAAFAGLFLIVQASYGLGSVKITGLLYAVASGILYALFVIVNRKAKRRVSNTSVTAIQMATASVVLLPFVLIGGLFGQLGTLKPDALWMILVLGVVHTGIAYLLFFPVFTKLPAVLISIMGYIEPVSSIAFAALLLGEALTLSHVFGGVLILGSTLFCVICEHRKNKAAAFAKQP